MKLDNKYCHKSDLALMLYKYDMIQAWLYCMHSCKIGGVKEVKQTLQEFSHGVLCEDDMGVDPVFMIYDAIKCGMNGYVTAIRGS